MRDYSSGEFLLQRLPIYDSDSGALWALPGSSTIDACISGLWLFPIPLFHVNPGCCLSWVHNTHGLPYSKEVIYLRHISAPLVCSVRSLNSETRALVCHKRRSGSKKWLWLCFDFGFIITICPGIHRGSVLEPLWFNRHFRYLRVFPHPLEARGALFLLSSTQQNLHTSICSLCHAQNKAYIFK